MVASCGWYPLLLLVESVLLAHALVEVGVLVTTHEVVVFLFVLYSSIAVLVAAVLLVIVEAHCVAPFFFAVTVVAVDLNFF